MKIDILTLFPEIFTGPFSESVLKRAQDRGVITIKIHNIRDAATDIHHTVDDSPYGGGPGMVMRVDVLDKALQKVITEGDKSTKPQIILMTPQGQIFNQTKAQTLSKKEWLIIICGHYEGYDERIRNFIDEEISLGDFVLTGGELPAAVITDAIVRLIPGVIGKEASLQEESFEHGLLEYPQYTRPEEYKGKSVPEVLLSGNHAQIAKWRHEQAKERTRSRRPDLLK